MKKIYSLLLLALPLTFSGCYLTDFDTPIDIDPTTLSLDILPLGVTEDDTEPEDYVGVYEDYTYALKSSNSLTWTGEFTSGTYTAYVYSTLDDQITIENKVASAGEIVVSSSYQYGVAENDCMNLYYGSKDIDIIAESDNSAQIEVSKIIKDLLFEISIEGDGANRVENITATMSGVAQSWELISNSPAGSSSTIDLPFADSFSSLNFSLIRLLGIDPSSSQVVTIAVDYTDGSPASQSETFDISSELDDFNTDKSATHDPISLVINSDYTTGDGDINDWENREDGGDYSTEQLN